jgi:hypothetical protein
MLLYELMELPSNLPPPEQALYEKLRKASIQLFEIASELQKIRSRNV